MRNVSGKIGIIGQVKVVKVRKGRDGTMKMTVAEFEGKQGSEVCKPGGYGRREGITVEVEVGEGSEVEKGRGNLSREITV